MKKHLTALAALAAAALTLITGCKAIPTPDEMKKTSTAIGAAAGLVANESKIDDAARNTVISIVEEVARITPKQGQTFEEAWTPVAKDVVAKLVTVGKITDMQGQLALAAFGIAVKGIDYLFDIRFPKARAYEDLVTAAIFGFTEGFLATFPPADASLKATVPADQSVKPDADALNWLREKAKAK